MDYQNEADYQLHQTKNRKSRVSSILNLPNFILVSILTRLPMDSILYCKCVCKEWCKILSDPHFVKIYVENPPFVSLLLSLHTWVSYSLEVKAGDDYGVYNHERTHIHNKLKLPKSRKKRLVVVGSSNGWLCLVKMQRPFNYDKYISYHRLYITNPILRERVKIPTPSNKGVQQIVYGFGYSTAADWFKLLRIAEHRQFNKSVAEVYTVGVDHSWRDVGEAPCPRKIGSVTLNGALHWIYEGNYDSDMYVFDIKEEKFRAVHLPDTMRVGSYLDVTVLKDCLCVFSHDGCHTFDIWWMKEYLVGESWTRDQIRITRRQYCINPPFPITIWRGGEILMFTRKPGLLYSYDPQREKFTQLNAHESYRDYLEVILFVPSLYSLKFMMSEDVHMINSCSES